MPNFSAPFGAAQRSEQAEGINPAREAQRALESSTSALLKGTANTLPGVYAAEDGPKITKEAGPAPADLELPFGEAEAAGAGGVKAFSVWWALPGGLLVGRYPAAAAALPVAKRPAPGAAGGLGVVRGLMAAPAGVRCFEAAPTQAELQAQRLPAYHNAVAEALAELEPTAEQPVPVAVAGIDDCLVGVLRWVTAGKRVAGCADFILRKISDGVRVFLHGDGGDGVQAGCCARTGMVAAVVLALHADAKGEPLAGPGPPGAVKRPSCSP